MYRFLFGFNTKASWPHKLPKGRLLRSDEWHLTLAFLGEVDFQGLLSHLDTFPKPSWNLGFIGQFDQALYLPPKNPKVVVWRGDLLDKQREISEYQRFLERWLVGIGFPPVDLERIWLPHVTLCHSPFDRRAWDDLFTPLPFYSSNLNLYRSIGNLRYEVLWSLPFEKPFDKTSSNNFIIKGISIPELAIHVEALLAFEEPILFEYFQEKNTLKSIEDIIDHLNQAIILARRKMGTSIECVKSLGLTEIADGLLNWEIAISTAIDISACSLVVLCWQALKGLF